MRKTKQNNKEETDPKSLGISREKEKAKKKFKVYPSIYANSWLVSEYKKAYEKKHGEGKEAYTGKKPKDSGLPKWFDEEWIDLSKSNPDKNNPESLRNREAANVCSAQSAATRAQEMQTLA